MSAESSTGALRSEEIADRFIELINWARGGSLLIVTPFIGDFTIGGSTVSSRIAEIIRATTKLTLIVAPQRPPHKCSRHANGSHLKCYFCQNAANFIRILDSYQPWAREILVMNDLHAKIYVARSQLSLAKCLTGSINLTEHSFLYYKEIGIFTTHQPLIAKIESFIDPWKQLDRMGEDPATHVEKKMVLPYMEWRRDFISSYPHMSDLV